jgi:predicted phage replisome organizer
MAEARYYWLRLQEDFFKSLRIKKLRRLAGGDTFTIIYLKMQLMTLKSDGILTYKGVEPTFAEELALDMDENADNVDITIRYLLSCGLLETSDDKEFFLPYAVENTGKEGSSAKRVREYRERKALQCNADVTEAALHCYGEKEIEKEIEIKKEKEDIAPDKNVGRKPARHKYGEYQNVLLSDEDLAKLKTEFPDWEARIERLSSYIAQSGKSYKNHLATIRNWARKDKESEKSGVDQQRAENPADKVGTWI